MYRRLYRSESMKKIVPRRLVRQGQYRIGGSYLPRLKYRPGGGFATRQEECSKTRMTSAFGLTDLAAASPRARKTKPTHHPGGRLTAAKKGPDFLVCPGIVSEITTQFYPCFPHFCTFYASLSPCSPFFWIFLC